MERGETEKAENLYPLFDYCTRNCSNNRPLIDEHFSAQDYEGVKDVLRDCSRSCEAYQDAKRGLVSV